MARKAKRGKHAVIAERRRFLALSVFTDNSEPDYPVDCRVVGADADATEISLAENVVRAPMHLVDQFKALSSLIDNDSSPGSIAARFGISEEANESGQAAQLLDPDNAATFSPWAGHQEPQEAVSLEGRGGPIR